MMPGAAEVGKTLCFGPGKVRMEDARYPGHVAACDGVIEGSNGRECGHGSKERKGDTAEDRADIDNQRATLGPHCWQYGAVGTKQSDDIGVEHNFGLVR